MIKRYVERQVHAAVADLSRSVRDLTVDVNGIKPGGNGIGDTIFHFSFGYAGLKTRVTNLEQKVDLLLKHLGLCKIDVPAKTVLKKCEKAK